MFVLGIQRLLCPSSMVTHLSCSNDTYITVPLSERGNIAVWNMSDVLPKPFILIGHHKGVTALCLSHQPVFHFLCSCSYESIILWDLTDNEGKPTKGKVLSSQMEEPMYCSFTHDNSNIFVSFSSKICIFDLKTFCWVTSVENAHFSLFTLDHKHNRLLGVDGNYVKCLDHSTNKLSTKICLSVGFPTTMDIHDASESLIVGTTCGHLNIYGRNFDLIRSIQMWKLLCHHLRCDSSEESGCKEFESDSFSIHAIHAFHHVEVLESDKFILSPVFLIVLTSSFLLIMEINSENLILFLDFNEGIVNGKEIGIGLCSFGSISVSSTNMEARVSLLPIISDSVAFLRLSLEKSDVEISTSKQCCQNSTENKSSLSFLNSDQDQNAKSLLNTTKYPKSEPKKRLKNSASNLNLPVTFHSSIKSSGYGTVHKKTTLFQPRIPSSHKLQNQMLLPIRKGSVVSILKQKSVFQQYENVSKFEKMELLEKLNAFRGPFLSSLQMSVDGCFVSSTSPDGLIDIFKLHNNKIKLHQTLRGHKKEVREAKWSHSERLIVSSGERTVKIWSLDKVQPLLSIGNDNAEASTCKHNIEFENEVHQAQFYQLDRFILAAAGSEVYLMKHCINIEKSGIKNVINKSSSKLIKKITLQSKRVTAIAAMNQFFSNLVVCAGTSKHVDVIDMTVGKVINHAHYNSERPIYTISLNEGSPFSSHNSMYDLFLTASLFDGIKVWDLRLMKPVMCYKQHKCRSIPSNAVFSPCGQFIATGSEDKSLYLYDLRQLSYMHKHSDSQMDSCCGVVFSPKSQVLTSSLNGYIYIFGEQ